MSIKQKSQNAKKKTVNNNAKKEDRIIKRQQAQKILVINELTNNPIITAVCQKTGVGQTTFYRWQKEDMEFKFRTEEAIKMGNLLINDLTKNMLIRKIKNGEDRALFWWLDRKHPDFMDPKFIPTQSVNNRITALSLKRKEEIVRRIKMWKALRTKSEEDKKS